MKNGFTTGWSSTSIGGHWMLFVYSSSSTRTFLNSTHKLLNSLDHSGQGNYGDLGSEFCSLGLSLLGIFGISERVAKFAEKTLVNGQSLCGRLSFFYVIQERRNWWES